MVARKIASIVEYDDMFCPDDETRTTQNRKRRFSRSEKEGGHWYRKEEEAGHRVNHRKKKNLILKWMKVKQVTL
eukprot:15347152-Ditylum_brightwellii.AAC.1